MAAIMILPLQAQVLVPNDGWEWDTTSTMTYHNMFFTDSSSVDGPISGEFSFNGDDAGDVGRWTKKFNLKFLSVMKMDIQQNISNNLGSYFTIELQHKDTILTANAYYHVGGSSSWATAGFSTWQGGTIDSIDAITIKLFYIAPTSFTKQRIRFDKLRFWTYEQGQLPPFYSWGDSGTIQGIVFHDSSGNGAKEPAEDGMAGQKVHIAGMYGYLGEYPDTLADSVLTDDLGRYQFKLPHGQYRLWQEVKTRESVIGDRKDLGYLSQVHGDRLNLIRLDKFGSFLVYAYLRGFYDKTSSDDAAFAPLSRVRHVLTSINKVITNNRAD